MPQRKRNPLYFASVIALIIVGAAAWYTMQDRKQDNKAVAETSPEQTAQLEQVRPVLPTDHVRGNPNAPLVFIVYSDFECPYCKEFHTTMKHLIELYGKGGTVAWVFRHMPLVQLHPESPTYAMTSECVAEKAGEEAFWNFADALFSAVTLDKTVGADKLLELGEQVGVDRQWLAACVRDNRYLSTLETDFNEAKGVGANGTPFTVVISPHQRFVVAGVRPLKAMVGAVLSVNSSLHDTGLVPPASTDTTNLFQNVTSTTAVGSPVASTSAVVGTRASSNPTQ